MLLKTAAASLAALLLGACATAPGSKPGSAPAAAAKTAERPQADARQAVDAIVEAYQAPRPEAFFALFDQDEFPSFEDFRYNTRQFMLNNRPITLSIVVDEVTSNDAGVAVSAHWNKSYVNAGVNKLASGSCELHFARGGQGLLLDSISGKSPF